MPFRDTPIRRKLMTVMLLTSGAVLLLTCAGFGTYEVITLRKGMVRGLITRAEIIAANSTAALAFLNVDDANDVLSALSADPRMVAACIYDHDGHVFAKYPTNAPLDSFPVLPGKMGHQFERSHLTLFAPITQGDRSLGIVYLKSDLTVLTDRYLAFALLALVIFAGSLVLAYFMSKALQKQISVPILALAGTAKAIANQQNYSVRAAKLGRDELGLLTDAFNQMLTQIQEQNESLRESEARVRAVLNSALSAVVIMDSAGKITDWNLRAEKMFGWTRHEAIGQELAKMIIPPRHRAAHRAGMKRFLETGEGPVLNRLVEMPALRRDGSELPVELSISPLKSGELTTFCGFITDITERKRQEEMRARFAAIVQSSDDAIISNTLDGVITSWNPGAEKLFGYTAEEILGQPMLALIPPGRADEEEQNLARVAGGETVRHYDTLRKRKDGTLVDTAVTISAIRDDEGKVVGASTVARDITERKRAEERFQRVVESAPSAIVLVSQEGKIAMVNAQTETLFGYSRTELIGQSIAILVPERFRGRAMDVGRDLFGVRKDGREVPVEIGLNPIELEEGVFVLASIIDITERKRSEERFRRVVESSPSAIVLVDQEGTITMVNAQTEKLFGYTRTELIGQAIEILVPERFRAKHPGYRGGFFASPSTRAMGAGRDLFGLHKEGREVPVEIGLNPIEINENIFVLASIIDITERKRSEERFRRVVESSPNAIVLVNQEGTITMVNAQTEKLFGYTRTELIGQAIESLVPERFRARHPGYRGGFFASPSTRAMGAGRDLFGLHKEGREVPVEIGLNPIETEEGTFVLASVIDITERKEAEKRERVLAKLGQSLSAVTSAASAARMIAEVADELFGWDACTLDLLDAEKLRVHPVINMDTIGGQRVEVPPAYFGQPPTAMMQQVLEKGGQLVLRDESREFPPEMIPFGNTHRPSASLIFVPIHRGEKIIGILSIQSYTPGAYNQQTLNTMQTLADQCGGALERVRAEENLRRLNEELEQRVRERTVQLEGARQELQEFIDGMSTLNAKVALDGTLLLVNKTAQLAFGLAFEELMRINFLEGSWWTFDPQVHARVREAFQKACQGETIHYEEKMFAFGRVIDISFSLVPVRGSDGQIGYVVAEGRDITALKHVEQSLAERTGQLEEANKELESFSYSVSHDLRAPLRHIAGFADMLRQESFSGLSPACQRYLEIITQAAKRMGVLIDDLLVFSRMGRTEMRQGRVDMDKLVAETLHDFAQDFQGRTVTCDVGPLPEVSGDRAMLKQVWVNLLSNALKYTRHREHAAIKISSRRNGREEWEFSVQDNGAGFDMRYADKLFGVFQRLHHTEEFEGTGIGLANIRRIILRHGGRTWAEGKVDAGATFYFTLPVHPNE